MNVQQFVSKWKDIELKEITTAQSHFIDVCSIVGHLAPLDADHKGEFFTFEIKAEKPDGEPGRADAWYKGKFIWEYKRPGSNLDKAYDQLLLYRESLGNPPLLITSDTHKIIVHTNFTNTAKKIYNIDFQSLLTGGGLVLLKNIFFDVNAYKPTETQEYVTKATAETFVAVADTLQQWTKANHTVVDSEKQAHFLIRLLFSLFAEDMKLLPDSLFTHLVTQFKQGTTLELEQFTIALRNLFSAMRDGGLFGFHKIRHFNGGLFDDDFVPDMPTDIIYNLLKACDQDWSNIDPSIFGTLFERIIDVSKKAQLGLHYTSLNDINLVVDPVLMRPLRDKWQGIRQKARDLLKDNRSAEAYECLKSFSDSIAATRVLDPACGSGNFLYVSLQQLLTLQKEVIAFSGERGLPGIPLTVGPGQLYGIEVNPYAHELAQITVWIGYLQWRFDNGFSQINDPILQPLHNIEQRDAIIANECGKITEPNWQQVDVIIGNPPFLGGGRRMREELGDTYVDNLLNLYRDRIPGGSDLVCYWFEKSRTMLETGKAKRIGLLATQSIRGGANRRVLDRVKETGSIFMAWSDREWVQDGVMVHVSMVGFDSGSETNITLNGITVDKINSDLTSSLDVTSTKHLSENDNVCFKGIDKSGDFELTQKQAKEMLEAKNSSDKQNRDVIKPYINALDITQHQRHMNIIDFSDFTEEEAIKYEKPFQYVLNNVKPHRDTVKRKVRKEKWWMFGETRPGMRKALASLSRYVVTPLTAKHRIYAWVPTTILSDQANFVFARDDDYFFGVLHSSVHETWVRRKGTQLREAESGSRYSPTETFETFPFPWPLGKEPIENKLYTAIANQAKMLNSFRDEWLHPEGVGTSFFESIAKKRTITSLYNSLETYRHSYKSGQRDSKLWQKETESIISLAEIEELDFIHNALDQAVVNAYGWHYPVNEEQIIEKLVELNLKRFNKQGRPLP